MEKDNSIRINKGDIKENKTSFLELLESFAADELNNANKYRELLNLSPLTSKEYSWIIFSEEWKDLTQKMNYELIKPRTREQIWKDLWE